MNEVTKENGKKNILIIDDEEGILSILARVITSDHVRILIARTIEDAEKIINNEQLDVVIADIRLTGVLGREGLVLLKYVRNKSPGAEVIIMTGYGSPEIKQEAYEKGAYFYFDKPVDPRLLKEKLNEIGVYRT